jgi:hypothetical protein
VTAGSDDRAAGIFQAEQPEKLWPRSRLPSGAADSEVGISPKLQIPMLPRIRPCFAGEILLCSGGGGQIIEIDNFDVDARGHRAGVDLRNSTLNHNENTSLLILTKAGLLSGRHRLWEQIFPSCPPLLKIVRAGNIVFAAPGAVGGKSWPAT